MTKQKRLEELLRRAIPLIRGYEGAQAFRDEVEAALQLPDEPKADWRIGPDTSAPGCKCVVSANLVNSADCPIHGLPQNPSDQSAPRLLGLEALERHVAEATAPRCSACDEPVIEPAPTYCPHCAVMFGGRFQLNREGD